MKGLPLVALICVILGAILLLGAIVWLVAKLLGALAFSLIITGIVLLIVGFGIGVNI